MYRVVANVTENSDVNKNTLSIREKYEGLFTAILSRKPNKSPVTDVNTAEARNDALTVIMFSLWFLDRISRICPVIRFW